MSLEQQLTLLVLLLLLLLLLLFLLLLSLISLLLIILQVILLSDIYGSINTKHENFLFQPKKIVISFILIY